VIPTSLFFGTAAPNIWTSLHPIAVLVPAFSIIFSLTTLFLAHWTDPGIIPRKKLHIPSSSSYQNLPPIQKEVIIRGFESKLKYCDTCKIYRPPRSSHCSTCDNCVEKFDHHCPWVGNCVGLRNYRFFFLFVVSTTFNLVYIFGICLASLILLTLSSSENGSAALVSAITKLPVSVFLILFCFFLFWSVAGLGCYHCYLICVGRTTNEELKVQKRSAYNFGCTINYHLALCGPWFPSYLDLRRYHYNPNEPFR